jgi:hypothetical protein
VNRKRLYDLGFTIHDLREENGKEITDRESEPETEILFARLHALQALRTPTRLSAQVQSVPNLLPRIGAARANPRRREIELVKLFLILDF